MDADPAVMVASLSREVPWTFPATFLSRSPTLVNFVVACAGNGVSGGTCAMAPVGPKAI